MIYPIVMAFITQSITVVIVWEKYTYFYEVTSIVHVPGLFPVIVSIAAICGNQALLSTLVKLILKIYNYFKNLWFSSALACSRLSVSGEDAKEKGTRKVGGAEKTEKGSRLRCLCSPQFPPVLFSCLIALSQFSGPDYLGARNRLHELPQLYTKGKVSVIVTLYLTGNST